MVNSYRVTRPIGVNYIRNNTLQVGNKSDKQYKRVVSHEKGQELAESYNIKFFETSAKMGNGVNEVCSDSQSLKSLKYSNTMGAATAIRTILSPSPFDNLYSTI